MSPLHHHSPTVLRCVLLAALGCSTLPAIALAQKQSDLGVESFIYVGTHAASAGSEGASGEARGIYLFRMRTSDDPNIPEFVTVTPLGLAAEADNPSFLALEPGRHLLFCVNEVGTF